MSEKEKKFSICFTIRFEAPEEDEEEEEYDSEYGSGGHVSVNEKGEIEDSDFGNLNLDEIQELVQEAQRIRNLLDNERSK